MTVEEFADELGVSVDAMPRETINLIEKKDIKINILSGEEKEKALLAALKRLVSDTQRVASPERTEVWQNGWNENKEAFQGGEENALRPRYFHQGSMFRWKQEFVTSDDPNAEYDVYDVIRTFVLETYAKDYDNIYEFGCGTGHNLVRLAELFPQKNLFGLDFVPSVVELLAEIRNKTGYNISGSLFDMIHPDYDYKLGENSCVFTFWSIEQLNAQTRQIVDYLYYQNPRLCVHLEPVIESYDDDVMIDWIAKQFHAKRGYETGLLSRIRKLETGGKAEIIKVKRIRFGNWNHEPNTLIVWRPLRK